MINSSRSFRFLFLFQFIRSINSRHQECFFLCPNFLHRYLITSEKEEFSKFTFFFGIFSFFHFSLIDKSGEGFTGLISLAIFATTTMMVAKSNKKPRSFFSHLFFVCIFHFPFSFGWFSILDSWFFVLAAAAVVKTSTVNLCLFIE